MLKPITTHYKGYAFRSRLEARWAVFFDAIGIPWEYEPEGFDLDGVYYLPDFHSKFVDTNGDTQDFWFEVKANRDWRKNPIEKKKIDRFAEALGYLDGEKYGRSDLILLEGMPEPGKAYPDFASYWGWYMTSHRGRPYHDDGGNVTADEHYCTWGTGDLKREQWACNAARSARFEHGHKGAVYE